MKIRSLFACILSLLLVAEVVHARTDVATPQPPPIEQALIREGDFALRLASALRLGEFTSEVEAEDRLASIGIAPRNGWIADYPMTPDIILEVQDAVAAAASSGKLPMSAEEALAIVQNVNSEFGLAVYSEAYPPSVDGQYYDQYYDATAIQDYYYGYGPPTVTYYLPPWDYSYLYSWVPYPFWWGGFGFAGYFILNDFHRVVVINKGFPHGRAPRYKMISNHYRDKGTGKFRKVDPLAGNPGNQHRRARNLSQTRGMKPGQAKRGAASIFARSSKRYTGNTAGRVPYNETLKRSPTGRAQLQSRSKAMISQGRNSGLSRSRPQRSNGYGSAPPTERYRSHQTSMRPSGKYGNSNYRTYRSKTFGYADRGTVSRGSSGWNRSFSPSRSGGGGFSSRGFRGASRGSGFGSRGGFAGGRNGGGGCRGRC